MPKNTFKKIVRHFEKTSGEEYAREYLQMCDDFVHANTPWLHKLIMRALPFTRTWFQYGLARNENDHMKLTLVRGKKIVARNFEMEGANLDRV